MPPARCDTGQPQSLASKDGQSLPIQALFPDLRMPPHRPSELSTPRSESAPLAALNEGQERIVLPPLDYPELGSALDSPPLAHDSSRSPLLDGVRPPQAGARSPRVPGPACRESLELAYCARRGHLLGRSGQISVLAQSRCTRHLPQYARGANHRVIALSNRCWPH